ncbi:MAG: hypothetical protein AB8B99_02590, partial [Phormidesmis sp.]
MKAEPVAFPELMPETWLHVDSFHFCVRPEASFCKTFRNVDFISSIVRTEKGEKIVRKAIRAYGLVNTTKPTKMAMPAIIPGLLSKVGYLA